MSDLIDGVLESSLIRGQVKYRVITPQKYSGSNARFSALYLLHGLFGSFENWTDLTDLQTFAVDHQLIIVMPDGADSWYTDAGSGREYESYLISELIPEIDCRFRTIADRSGRAVAGNSMGGYGAFKFALKYSDRFALAASFSGAFDASSPKKFSDARLDFCARSAEAQAAGGDQAVRARPTGARCVMQIKPDGGSWRAASQQPRPGREVGKIEQGVGSAQTDLPGKDQGVLGTGAAGDDRSGVAEHG